MKILRLIIALQLIVNIYSSEENSVIQDASYLIYDGSTEVYQSFGASHYANFYTFDGERLRTIKHNNDYYAMEQKLDINARKPQPKKLRLFYCSTAMSITGQLLNVQSYLLFFYDKHCNKIYKFYYDGPFPATINTISEQKTSILKNNNQLFKIGELLDLSIVENLTSQEFKELNCNANSNENIVKKAKNKKKSCVIL